MHDGLKHDISPTDFGSVKERTIEYRKKRGKQEYQTVERFGGKELKASIVTFKAKLEDIL